MGLGRGESLQKLTSRKNRERTAVTFSEAVPVASVASRKQEILENEEFTKYLAELATSKEGGARWDLLIINGRIKLPDNVPPLIKDMVQECLDSEKRLNPETDFDIATLTLKMQSSDDWKSDSEPHFDNRPERKVVTYIAASEPATVQYLGETADREALYLESRQKKMQPKNWLEKTKYMENPAAASLLPWTIYRADENFLHSAPWKPEKKMPARTRFLFRLALGKEVD